MEVDFSGYKLLVVDDVQTNVLLLKALLGREGYTILVASDGFQALELAAREKPDLILLDVMMPGMDGFAVLREIRRTSRVPVLMLTARGEAEDRIEGLDDTESIVKGFKLGASDFVSKPFRKEELMVRIKHQLSLVAALKIITAQTEELKKTIAGRDKLYSVIAHDLRSPMASMKMLLNTILMSVDRNRIDPDIYDMLEMSNRTSEELFGLLDNLLKWTKSQLGKLVAVKNELNLTELAEGVVEVMRPVADSKHITLSFSGDPICLVRVDIEMIKSVIRNLISNAIKFSDMHTGIEVSVKEEGEWIVGAVQDHGRGIKKDSQDKLLNEATHFTTFGTNSEEGSGLGLLLCRDFVHINGGKLWFTSEEGVGSIFSFSLPKLV